MVIFHLNLHASQTYPLTFNDNNNNDNKKIPFEIKVATENDNVALKQYNSLSSGFSGAGGKCVSFEDDSYFTFVINVDKLTNLKVPVTLYDTTDSKTIGSCVVTKDCLHDGEESYGTMKLDVLNESQSSVATISFDYQILPSEVTYDLSAGGKNASFDASFDDFVYIGHRGDGSTSERSIPYLENTISSFVKAQNHGASFVELDVQLTKDHIPVIFHDDFVAVIEADKEGKYKVEKVPVKDLTLEEIRKKNVDFARTDIGLNYDDRFKDLFPTLKELIEKMPSTLGIFMEIKYPEPDQDIKNLIAKNIVVDRILEVLSELVVKQPIMFCSFDPEICLMLKHKQNMYPVFFITCGENCFTSYNPWEPFDMRTRTRMIAANFAISHDLKGISINGDPLMNSKVDYVALTTYLKGNDKLLFSWGKSNCHREYANIQKSVKMAGVISDRLINLEITSRNA